MVAVTPLAAVHCHHIRQVLQLLLWSLTGVKLTFNWLDLFFLRSIDWLLDWLTELVLRRWRRAEHWWSRHNCASTHDALCSVQPVDRRQHHQQQYQLTARHNYVSDTDPTQQRRRTLFRGCIPVRKTWQATTAERYYVQYGFGIAVALWY